MVEIENVLIVNDDEAPKGVCEQVLKGKFCIQRIWNVSNGLQALKILEKSPMRPAHWLILLELYLSGMDGFQVTERIREKSILDVNTLRLRLLRSFHDPNNKMKGRNLGMSFLRKQLVDALHMLQQRILFSKVPCSQVI